MWRLTLRNLAARKVRLLMSTVAIVLGIGFLAGVMTFSGGLGRTFDGIISGSTPDGVVRQSGEVSFSASGAGTTARVTPAEVAELAALPQVAAADGSVDGLGAFLLDTTGKLVGGQGAPTLAFNYTPTDNLLGEPILELRSGAWPTGDDDIVLDEGAADRAGYRLGDEVTLVVPFGEPRRTFRLTGTATFNGGGTAGAILLVLSTHGAQVLFLDGQDAFTSVALTAAPGVSQQALADAAQKVVPEGFTAVTGDTVVSESQNQVNQFLDVITIFLTVFAVIAVVVGGFIIFNTFTILVAQRVRESALLRALGASRRQVTGVVLVEALAMALVGVTLGVLLGWGVARALAALFSGFGLTISSAVLGLETRTVLTGYLVGVLVTMVAALLPALRAARVPPVAALREDLVVQERSLQWRTVLGTIALVTGAVVAWLGLFGGVDKQAVWVGVAALVWVVTCAVMAPVLGRPVLLLVRGLFGRMFGMTGRLAGENALRNPRRTGATASALMIGLAVVSAVGVLAASMSRTTDEVIDEQFTSDFLVTSAGFQSFPTAVGDAMEKVPGVARLGRMQGVPALVDGEQEFLLGIDRSVSDTFPVTMESGTNRISGAEVLLSSAQARSMGVGTGGTVALEFAGAKKVQATVAGVFTESEVLSGVNVPLDLLVSEGINRSDFSLSIDLAPGADRAAAKKALDGTVADLPMVTVQDKADFADLVKGQINQLLALIYGLLALAVVIAVFGIVNTLGLSVTERTRELGLLRALGLTRGRVRLMVTCESVAIALLGAVLGLGVGVLSGVLLRYALRNDLTALALPWASLLAFLVVSVVFGVLAALVPAVRASRLKVLDAIATE